MMKTLDGEMTAREMTQMFTGTEGYEQIPYPQKCDQRAAATPDVYTDGSIINPKGLHWSIGGIGVWWPGRTKDATDAERQVAHTEKEEGGMMMWTVFNNLTVPPAAKSQRLWWRCWLLIPFTWEWTTPPPSERDRKYLTIRGKEKALSS